VIVGAGAGRVAVEPVGRGRLAAAGPGPGAGRTVAVRRGGVDRVDTETKLATCPRRGGHPGGYERELMHPLLFVNWSSVNVVFRGLMWIVVIVLAGVIVTHLAPASVPAHHAIRVMR
jgi:hypothetical protein